MGNPSDLTLNVASALSLGERERQEDALAVAFPDGSDLGFAVLSDGMGGHAAGDLASRIIVSEVFAELTLRGREPKDLAPDMPLLLRHAVNVANDSLRAHVEASPNRHGMGGTVIATAVLDDQLFWISVGDSALYLFRDGALSRLNDVHSMAKQIELMVAKGMMDARTAEDHPQRNCLTSAVMGDELAEVDCPPKPFQLRPDDVILVASDGIDVLAHGLITEILRNGAGADSRSLSKDLIAAVADAGDPHQDNTSIIVIKTERNVPELVTAAPTVHKPGPLARAFAWMLPRRVGG
ncbi:protein phosphatase 2C domain-containing protein [Gymnodinialimonas sp. 2305UL16-5]|uniref:PP2C family protein-serine/threonine phosphatase n=1 Tax=Gymnodinialimonas mytili TaxID=3126503 RepID=UPI0030A87CB1